MSNDVFDDIDTAEFLKVTTRRVNALVDLHEGQLSKESSSRYRRFVEAHGDRSWELESLTTDQLREIVEATIRGVLDVEAFEAEVERECEEQQELDVKRRQIRQALIDDLD